MAAKHIARPVLVLLAGLAAFSPAVFSPAAWGQHASAKGNPCPKSSNAAQCFLTAAQDTNTALKDTYKRIWKSLASRPKQQAQLQAANDLWLRTRSADCEGERDIVEASTAQAAYYACLEAENRQRTSELQTMFGWWLKK